jgi:sterol desaturase/sphingolipid hydroxylase (fatty acid hydroxylase superfamily)
MDDTKYGEHKKSGFVPKDLISYGPLFAWPPKPLALLKWVPEYLFPWNSFYTLLGIMFWFWLTPPLEDMATFQVGWIAYLAALNYAFVIVYYGLWHGWLYSLQRQGTRFKYNARWPAVKNAAFMFGKQNSDNIFWALVSGVPIFTAFMVASFWLFANDYVSFLNYADNPVWFVVFLLLIPFIGEVHFFAVHRLIHVPFLYKHIHSLHHNNVNPAPWSGLSMHPVEHLLYFSGIILVTLMYAHPVHMLAYALRVVLGPAVGHTGFDKLEVGETKGVDAGIYAHYLHHKLFEVNYADGAIPLDKWFGSFHDGSPEAEDRLKVRMKKRKEKLAKAAG